MRPIAIDLFAGAGGLSLGFEQAGFDVLAAVENDPIHSATHKFNFPDCKVFCKSVSDVTGEEIRSQSSIQNREVAVLFGGSPCQGYSLIGKRALDDPRNSLVREFVRLVKEIQPQYFVFENVPGLTIGKHAAFLREIIEEFEKAGYSLRLPYQVLHAVEFGVPQARKRLFLLGAKRGLLAPEYPGPTNSDRTRRTVNRALITLPTGPSVWDALGDLPEVEEFEDLLESDSVDVSYGIPSRYASKLRGLEIDSGDFSHPRVTDPTMLTSSMRTVHTPLSMQRFASTKNGEVEPVSRFLKLDLDGVCNTLRAGTGAERGAFTSPRPIHPCTPRCITVREAARLHSYPDWFRFHKTKWHGFRQVGNSVPPLLARAVASSISKAMGYAPQKPKTPVRLGDEELLAFDLRSAGAYFQMNQELLPRRRREVSGALSG